MRSIILAMVWLFVYILSMGGVDGDANAKSLNGMETSFLTFPTVQGTETPLFQIPQLQCSCNKNNEVLHHDEMEGSASSPLDAAAASEEWNRAAPQAFQDEALNNELELPQKKQRDEEISQKRIESDEKVIKQVIFIEPPPYVYNHNVNLGTANQGKRARTVIYVFPPMVKHIYNITDKRALSEMMKEPQVYYLSSGHDDGKIDANYKLSESPSQNSLHYENEQTALSQENSYGYSWDSDNPTPTTPILPPTTTTTTPPTAPTEKRKEDKFYRRFNYYSPSDYKALLEERKNQKLQSLVSVPSVPEKNSGFDFSRNVYDIPAAPGTASPPPLPPQTEKKISSNRDLEGSGAPVVRLLYESIQSAMSPPPPFDKNKAFYSYNPQQYDDSGYSNEREAAASNNNKNNEFGATSVFPVYSPNNGAGRSQRDDTTNSNSFGESEFNPRDPSLDIFPAILKDYFYISPR